MGKMGKVGGFAVLNLESFERLRINLLDFSCGTSMIKRTSQEKLRSIVYEVQDGVVGSKSLSPLLSTQAQQGIGVSVPASWTITDTVPVSNQRMSGQTNAANLRLRILTNPDIPVVGCHIAGTGYRVGIQVLFNIDQIEDFFTSPIKLWEKYLTLSLALSSR